MGQGDMGQGDIIENHFFDEIAVRDSASPRRTLSNDDIAVAAIMAGDVIPAHPDESDAQAGMRGHHIIGHGRFTDMADANAAGIVLGARVAVMLTSGGDTPRTRIASAAVAVPLARAQRQTIAAGE